MKVEFTDQAAKNIGRILSASSADNDIMLRHEELKQDLAKKMEAFSFWLSTLESPHMLELINEMHDSIQRNRIALEDAKSEDIKTNQAQIVARKQVISYISARKSELPVLESRKRLEEYERDNAIFLNDASETKSKKK